MALLPSTPATRRVPVAGRQFAERRLIRGVGAAERAVGNAWGRMTSRQREYYGNQKNFAGGLQRESNRRKAEDEKNEDNAQQDQGRQDAMGDAPPAAAAAAPPKPPTNHAREVMQTSEEAYAERMGNRRRSDMARMKTENPDRYERINAALEVDKGVPRERPGWQDKPDMDDAVASGRVGGVRRPDPESAPEPAPAAPKPISGRTPESDDVGRRMALALAARRDNRKTRYAIDTAYAEHNLRESKFKGLKEMRGFDMGERPYSDNDHKYKKRPRPTSGYGPQGFYSGLDWNEKQRLAHKYQNSRMDNFEESM